MPISSFLIQFLNSVWFPWWLTRTNPGFRHGKASLWTDSSVCRLWDDMIIEKLEIIVSLRLGPNPINVDIAKKGFPLVLWFAFSFFHLFFWDRVCSGKSQTHYGWEWEWLRRKGIYACTVWKASWVVQCEDHKPHQSAFVPSIKCHAGKCSIMWADSNRPSEYASEVKERPLWPSLPTVCQRRGPNLELPGLFAVASTTEGKRCPQTQPSLDWRRFVYGSFDV